MTEKRTVILKPLCIAFNIILMLIGIAMLTVGLILKFSNIIQELTDSDVIENVFKIEIIPYSLIGAGVFFLFISVFGITILFE